MANSGGGVIVYGVEEDEKSATRRTDTGEFTERHERAYRSAAITAISPPIFGLTVHRLGTDVRAVIIEVPASVDGPHLIYKNDLFGAPIRNDADTVWMKERQIEAMYRARFDERRRSSDALESLYAEAATGRDSDKRAWLVAVAHPRIPDLTVRPDREQARQEFGHAKEITLTYSTSSGIHPFENVDILNPRPGLRRWTAVNTATGDRANWKEAWAEVHHDGSVMLAAAVGGHRMSADGYHEGWQIEGRGIECCIADFTALIRATVEDRAVDEFEVRVGIEWQGSEPLQILTIDNSGFTYTGTSTPLRNFTPVRATINASAPNAAFHEEVFRLAEDCVNQGGITYLHTITPPPNEQN